MDCVLVFQGRPGLLSEFYIEVQKDSSVTLESVVHRGSYLSVSESGQVEPAKKDCDKRNLFDVRVKVMLFKLLKSITEYYFNKEVSFV